MHRFRLLSTALHGNLPLNQQHGDAFHVDHALLLRWLLAAGPDSSVSFQGILAHRTRSSGGAF